MARKPPLRIWLQVPEDWDGIPTDDMTWCSDKINDTDICYIRAGKPRPKSAEGRKDSTK